MIEEISKEAPEESSTHKEVVRTIASGINSIKTQMVNMTNRNKKMWRAVARSSSESAVSLNRELEGESSGTPGRYNLRSTPTRQAAAAKNQKRTAKAVTNEQGRSSSENDVTDDVIAHSISRTDKSVEAEASVMTESMDSKETVDSKSLEPSESPTTKDGVSMSAMQSSTTELVATVTMQPSIIEHAEAMVATEPSTSEHTGTIVTASTSELAATVTVPVTELERAKQMAQQLTALIVNLEHQESELTTFSQCV